METIKKEEAAFPILDPNGSYYNEGMTLRDYFAAKALQATDLEQYANVYGNEWAERVAKDSYLMADAMLKQRQAIEKAL